MFNLFRRSKNKSKNKTCATPQSKNDKVATPNAEKYRPLSEDVRERAVVLPTAIAAIEELEDLHDLDQEAEGLGATGAYVANKRNNKNKNGDKFYFDEEVNIAKTAPNFTANKAAAETTRTAAGEAEWRARSANSATGGLSNIATALEFSKINKIVAATWDDDVHSQSSSSRNELAERQGRVSIGDKSYSNKTNNNNNRVAGHRKAEGLRNQQRSETNALQETKENVEPVTTKTTKKTTTTTVTTATAEEAAAPSWNEVKYRNPSKTHVTTETKRTSWLGLTLVNGRNKGNADQGEEATRKKTEASARKSFFLGKSKSIDNDKLLTAANDSSAVISRPNSSLFYNEAESALQKPQQAGGVERKKLKPLEKSRDFLSEILMARGRNHNRNRNHHQQQKQQKQHNAKHLQTGVPDKPEEHSRTAASSNHNHNNNTAINVINNVAVNATHLEPLSIYDPSSVSTNSYQMTTSNNSYKNVSRRACEQLSKDSAESSDQLPDPAPDEQRRESLPTTTECAEAVADETVRAPLNCLTTEQQINGTPSIERNAFPTEPQPTNSLKLSEDVQVRTEANGTGTETSDRDVSAGSSANEAGTNEAGANEAGANEAGAKSQLDELTECDRDRWLNRAKADVATSEMGQTNGKPDTPAGPRASTPREFRESDIGGDASGGTQKAPEPKPTVVVPTITVMDYSDGSSGDGSPVEQDVFYDFESGPRASGVKIAATEEEGEEAISICAVDDEVDESIFHEPSADANTWHFVNPHSRLSNVALPDVPEQAEEEDEDEEEENYGEEAANGAGETSDDLDNGRPPLKSTNTSDSNLSNSFPDSGIGDSFASHSGSPSRVLLLDSCDLLNERTADPSRSTTLPPRVTTSPPMPASPAQRLPFVRDGYSTDCDETLMQCDDFDFVADAGDALQTEAGAEERLVCIESISLPDVVVESTANSTNNGLLASGALASAASSGGEQIININGATGNSMGNVHFIPIHVEGSADGGVGQKRRSLDDSVIGSGGKKSYASLNGHRVTTTIEITPEEDDDEQSVSGKNEDSCIAEKLKRDLVDQESRYNAQLEDAQKNAYNLQTRVNEMQTRIETLEKDLSIKTWNVERLQGELGAAHKDDEYVRKRLKLLEDERTNLRHKYSDNEEELKRRYEELEQKYKEMEEKYKETRQLASTLQTQLAAAQTEAEDCRQQVEQMREEMEEQVRILSGAVENSEAERKISEDKWQKEFEMLRTHNQDREESLMTDCEWQLRQMQKVCKEKIDKAEHGRREALGRAETLEGAAQERLTELQNLRVVETEVQSLRGLTAEQEYTLQTLMEQIESLKGELQTANENLEEQIEAVRQIKYQCDNKIYDKERELIQRIDHVRNEAAAFWEKKLYTEMTRLKSELESVYIDERRESLDKLQAEHIEELRALTTRYTANEEELRAELGELQERFELKNSEFLELREKSDNALLQTRMHLDRADREYQNAMFREEERREALEESLRKDFETEKLEMEEKFRERLGQVKEEFNRELQLSTQDMVEKHRNEMEKQKAKLQAERDEAMQELMERNRKKLADAEDQMRDIELRQQRDLKDLKAAYDAEKASLDKRDISNANEIEQLHRKCRCLTNLFEEMRMRYERRDPRPEDLREIAELRSRCESQERDLYLLTDRLREMQIQMEELQQNGDASANGPAKGGKAVKKPPPKTIPTNCDVIYEENEERDSPPPPASRTANQHEDQDDDGDEEEGEDEDEDEYEEASTVEQNNALNGQVYNKKKCSDRINEDDGHMITAV